MANENVNHVVINGVTKLDLRSDTATAADVAAGKIFHLASGARVQGTMSDGNSIEYGITDGTLPLAGVAKAGYAEI